MPTVDAKGSSLLRLAWPQMPTHWHNPAANREQYAALFEQHLTRSETDLVVLPEMFTTGFTMASAEMAEPMDGPSVSWMREQAQRWQVTLCGSIVIAADGEFYNRLLWVSPSGAVSYYDKRHRFRMAAEHQHYAAGTQRQVFQLGQWRVLASVCYDLRFPVWLRNRGDYDLLVCVANWPAARQTAWDTLLAARAVENQCYALGVNVLGTDGNNTQYSGGSALIASTGDAELQCGATSNWFHATLDRQDLQAQRDAFPVWRDADEFNLH